MADNTDNTDDAPAPADDTIPKSRQCEECGKMLAPTEKAKNADAARRALAVVSTCQSAGLSIDDTVAVLSSSPPITNDAQLRQRIKSRDTIPSADRAGAQSTPAPKAASIALWDTAAATIKAELGGGAKSE